MNTYLNKNQLKINAKNLKWNNIKIVMSLVEWNENPSTLVFAQSQYYIFIDALQERAGQAEAATHLIPGSQAQ